MSIPKDICGVAILRSYVSAQAPPKFVYLTHFRGGALERGFRRVINDVPVGSLLVQSDAKTGEPMLLHAMLPRCVRLRHLAEDSWVFLLDAQVWA